MIYIGAGVAGTFEITSKLPIFTQPETFCQSSVDWANTVYLPKAIEHGMLRSLIHDPSCLFPALKYPVSVSRVTPAASTTLNASDLTPTSSVARARISESALHTATEFGETDPDTTTGTALS